LYKRCVDFLFAFCARVRPADFVLSDFDGYARMFAQWAESEVFRVVWTARALRFGIDRGGILERYAPEWGLGLDAIRLTRHTWSERNDLPLGVGCQAAWEKLEKENPVLLLSPAERNAAHIALVRLLTEDSEAVGFALVIPAGVFVYCDAPWAELGLGTLLLAHCGSGEWRNLLTGMDGEASDEAKRFIDRSARAESAGA